jgi:hypothetical protein
MVNLFQNNSIRQKRYQELSSLFIKIAPENPVLWTGMKGASAESRKNKSDAETSSA